MNLAVDLPIPGGPMPVTPGPVVLWGYMGAGKSTVGRLLAGRLGRKFVDLDVVLESHLGTPIATFFATRGESDFRETERVLLLEALESLETSGGVLAVGGGALLEPALRAAVRERATLVTLGVSAEVATRRLRSGPGEAEVRPLFDADFASRLTARAAAYADADLVIDTTDATPDEVVTAVEGALRTPGVL